MLKKIHVEQLRVGMYLKSFCGAWIDHPFWRNSFVLKDPEDIRAIRASCITEVWIDAGKGLDVEAGEVAGLVTFRWNGLIERLRNPVQLFDAAGLALFAVLGTGKALAFGLSPFAATLLGMVTGIGGGIARDILVARTPVVLQAELYAVAALVGGGVVALASALQLPQHPAMVVGALACFGLRWMALRHGWRLPVARPRE